MVRGAKSFFIIIISLNTTLLLCLRPNTTHFSTTMYTAEATGLGFVCVDVINPRMLSANRVDFDFGLFFS